MKSLVSKRFVECLEILRQEKKVSSFRKFAESLGYLPQSLSEVMNNKRDVPLEIMRKAVEVYQFNPVYLCLGEGPRFLSTDNPTGLQVLSIAIDTSGKEKIVHVPIPAEAGYVADLSNVEFLQELPSYNLPDFEFTQGTFRSFDVKGESMIPTLDSGDKVICKYIERDFWFTDVKENNIYVIVTRDGIVVKRVQNRLRNRQFLRLVSDNDSFNPYVVEGNEIKEIWKVQYRITPVNHLQSYIDLNSKGKEDISEIKEALNQHSDKIDSIYQILNKSHKRNMSSIVKNS